MSAPPRHNPNILPPIGSLQPGIPSMLIAATTGSMQTQSMNAGVGLGVSGLQNGSAGGASGGMARRLPPPLDTMRAYRACLNCRNRKSKCDLDVNGGRPPCRRCQRENKECILGESHRGGRRVRKKPKTEGEETAKKASQPSTPTSALKEEHPKDSPHSTPQSFQPESMFRNSYDGSRQDGLGWRQPPGTAGSDGTVGSRQNEHGNITSPSAGTHYRQRAESIISQAGKPDSRLQESITSADLQNPSDALEILAQVADRAEDGSSSGSERNELHRRSFNSSMQDQGQVKGEDYWYYKPIQDGLIAPETVYNLFRSFKQFFHPFFPITPRSTFNPARLPWLSRHEPHLFSAILTVASKDDERTHQVCYDHMQHLISDILAGAEGNVEAVEAFLLLSQWVSHRPQANIAVGRGEEDRVAWMYIGTALRLGYFLGIDRTSFKRENNEDLALFNRKRLVWAACYICDRQVSVRAGKGFWARGPGPLSGLRSTDFPTLQKESEEEDDLSLIFQANLELTQIFSNVHDILYSSKGHGWEEMLQGRYAKYLDDFRTSIRCWNDVWGDLLCSQALKASLLLTYDYLRLYVNAFAYQATISRALSHSPTSFSHNPLTPLPLINASAPDARFIYEAIDAAVSLLTTFNSLVDPSTLRYMPSSYYLFIIYSAVFLYKARVTTTMTEEEKRSVRGLIAGTVDRLQRSGGEGGSGMGGRYARLLQLLWRKSPRKPHGTHHDVLQRQSIDGRITSNPSNPNHPGHSQQNSTSSFTYANIPTSSAAVNGTDGFGMQNQGTRGDFGINGVPQQGFSWLDLSGAWNYATHNGHFDDPGLLGTPTSLGGDGGAGGAGAGLGDGSGGGAGGGGGGGNGGNGSGSASGMTGSPFELGMEGFGDSVLGGAGFGGYGILGGDGVGGGGMIF